MNTETLRELSRRARSLLSLARGTVLPLRAAPMTDRDVEHAALSIAMTHLGREAREYITEADPIVAFIGGLVAMAQRSGVSREALEARISETLEQMWSAAHPLPANQNSTEGQDRDATR